MLCIRDLKPTLNVQSHSLRAKVFMQLAWHFSMQIRFQLSLFTHRSFIIM